MTTIVTRAALAAAVLFVAAAGPARAESLDVKIPFSFVVHGQTLPAGEYRVETDGPFVLLRGEHGNMTSIVFSTMRAEGRDPAGNAPALTFRKGQSQYRLADIWESASRGAAVQN